MGLTLGAIATAVEAQNSEAPQKSPGESSLLRAILGTEASPPVQPARSKSGQGSAPPPESLPKSAKDAQLLRGILGTQGNSAPPSRSNSPIAQAVTFPDIRGHWAQPFIEALASRGIIEGFPDGTFRPNQPVTRVQFAALIRQAFPIEPIRPGIDFVDVSRDYWGYEAIQAAYQRGFLEGYPNRVFLPDQNIPRVQALVSLASGLNLTPDAPIAEVLDNFYQDAEAIPAYAREAVAAATESEVVVNFPNVAFLNPNETATRADVAAFIYQALVEAGALPPLPPTNMATDYIVNYQPPIAELDPDQVRAQLLLPVPPLEERLRRVIGGGSGIGTPTAFGADRNTLFGGFSFQERTRFSDDSDGGISLGVGVGDARQLVGVEVVVSIYDLLDDTFEDGGVSFKVHRTFPGDLAVAVGVENFDTWGEPDPGYSSVYGVVSKVFPLGQPNTAGFVPSVTTTVGLGGGRFRSEDDIEDGDESVNVFGSVGVRVVEPITLKAEWTGQDLNLGASIYPIQGVPLVITPAAADVTNNAGDGTRFILGVGYGIQF
jgi:hypothetical protein